MYLNRIRPWVDECLSKHPTCRAKQDSYFPSRVLDVKSEGSDSLSLVLFDHTLTGADYVCLSHCWGSTRPLLTNRQNLQSHIDGLQLQALPQTFQDAVKLTRYIGFRYLWIDSLCIVQDDEIDWVAQSSQMNETFSNAVLTIAAMVSEDSRSGLFKSTETHLHEEIADPRSLGVSSGLFARVPEDHAPFKMLEDYEYGIPRVDVIKHPLLWRAWAYQELPLSPRVLCFGHNELVWQCFQSTLCCCSPHRQTYTGAKPAIARLLQSYNVPSPYKGVLDKFTAWYRIVGQYSTKAITKESDRLPALSGVAKRFISIRNCRYLAGLWEDNLLKELCWRRRAGKAQRPSQYIGPSWSWISVFGDINWISDSKMSTLEAEIIEVVCYLLTQDPTGMIHDASLRICSYVLSATVIFESFDEEGYAILDEKGAPATRAMLCVADKLYYVNLDSRDDWVDTQELETPVLGLRIGSNPDDFYSINPPGYIEFVMLLRPATESKREYRRVGCAECKGRVARDAAWEKMELTII